VTERGLVVVISAPSGGGKSSVIREILKKGGARYVYSISTTTRERRENEVDGTDYFFVSEDEFHKKIQASEFIEWAIVHGNYYGSSKAQIDEFLKDEKIILLDIDVQGGLEIKNQYQEKALLIFIMPPNIEELEKRLRNRQTDNDKEITKRLAAVPLEIGHAPNYDNIVVNEKLDKTVLEIIQIIEEKYNS
jgi:guanylate kinase